MGRDTKPFLFSQRPSLVLADLCPVSPAVLTVCRRAAFLAVDFSSLVKSLVRIIAVDDRKNRFNECLPRLRFRGWRSAFLALAKFRGLLQQVA